MDIEILKVGTLRHVLFCKMAAARSLVQNCFNLVTSKKNNIRTQTLGLEEFPWWENLAPLTDPIPIVKRNPVSLQKDIWAILQLYQPLESKTLWPTFMFVDIGGVSNSH